MAKNIGGAAARFACLWIAACGGDPASDSDPLVGAGAGGMAAPQTGGMGAPATGGTSAPQTGGMDAPQTGGVAAPQTGGMAAPQTGGVGAPQTGGMGAPATGGMDAPATGGMSAPQTGGMDAPATGGSDAGPPAPDDEVDVAVEGPYDYDTFTEGAGDPAYAEGLVYYPIDAQGPLPVMILSPGLTADNTDYEVWGRVLASHAIVAMLLQPTSTGDWNDARAVDLEAALSVVRGGLNESGPLAGMIDTANVGFMGQSMGGGGTLIAADQLGDEIQAAIPMQPYAPGSSFRGITTPTLIIAAERDTVASVSSNAFQHYSSIPDTTVKIYMEAAGADHYYSTDRNDGDFDMNARYAVAFLKLYLEGDARYEPYLYGTEHEAVASEFSRYLTSQ